MACICALGPGPIAAPGLAIHHRRPQGPLRMIIRRVDQGLDQEPEPRQRMGPQMGGQTPIGRRAALARRQFVQPTTERRALVGQPIVIDPISTPQPTQRISLLDQFQHAARQTGRRTASRFEHLLAASPQMSQALLVGLRGEAVVNAPAVMDQRTGPVQAQQLFGRPAAARRVDHIARRARADEIVQPGIAAADLASPSRQASPAAKNARRDGLRCTRVRNTSPCERALVPRETSIPSNVVASSLTHLPCERRHSL